MREQAPRPEVMPPVSGSTVYFCWICGVIVPPDAPASTHYESERVILFCNAEHWASYQDLRGL